jgi:hypothetical protein
VAEAVLQVHKSNYGKKSQNGGVKLIKGRKYIGPSYDSLNVRLYAGAHHAHRFDFVMRREGPLNKRDLRKYNFQIQDTLRYENENLIVISFEPLKGSGGNGQLYITQDTYAFVKGVFYYEDFQEDLQNQLRGLMGNYQRSYLNDITEYSKQDSLWRFKFSEYHTAFDKGENAALFLNSTLTITDFVADDQGIPYAERIQFHDIVLNKTGEYDHDFWEGYNIVSYKPSLSKIADGIGEDWNNAEESAHKKGSSRVDKILHIASKVRIAYGLFYFKSALDPLEITLNHSSLGLEERIGQGTLHTYGLASNIGYEISDEWIISFDEITSFSSRAYSSKALGISWERNLRPSKRPLYINPGLEMGMPGKGLR